MLQRPHYSDYLNKTVDQPTLTVIPPSLPPKPLTPNRHPPLPFSAKKGSSYINDTPNTLASPSDRKEQQESSVIRDINGLSRFNYARRNAQKLTSSRQKQQRISMNKSDSSPQIKTRRMNTQFFNTDHSKSFLLKPQQNSLYPTSSNNKSYNDLLKKYQRKTSRDQDEPYGYKSSYEPIYTSKTPSYVRSSLKTEQDMDSLRKAFDGAKTTGSYGSSSFGNQRPKTAFIDEPKAKHNTIFQPITFRDRSKSKDRIKQYATERKEHTYHHTHKPLIPPSTFKSTYQHQTRPRKTSTSISSQQLKIRDFALGKKLGEGRFGHVFMAIHKLTGAIFALKRVPKSIIKQSMMINQFALEVRIQASFNDPNIVSVYAVFDDKQHVYLLLEYLTGGSLYGELKKKGKYEEKEAAVRVRALCKAVNALHEQGVAHRDIKPENIMMCEGQCKLGDFGWATICNQMRTTYCGTTDYVSPQIIGGQQYGHGVDMWCIGVYTFELLSGKAPFYHLSKAETFKKIEHADPTYPPYFSSQAKDFIGSLLRKIPEDRMSAPDALSHPFLKQVAQR